MWWHASGRLPEALSELHCRIGRPKKVLLKYSGDKNSGYIVVRIIHNITTIFVSYDWPINKHSETGFPHLLVPKRQRQGQRTSKIHPKTNFDSFPSKNLTNSLLKEF